MKGLEALNKIANIKMKEQYKTIKGGCFVYRVVSDDYSKELKIIEKELKALEIVKNKRVDIVGVLIYAFNQENGCEFYNSYMSKEIELTQEEYDLLKEILSND